MATSPPRLTSTPHPAVSAALTAVEPDKDRAGAAGVDSPTDDHHQQVCEDGSGPAQRQTEDRGPRTARGFRPWPRDETQRWTEDMDNAVRTPGRESATCTIERASPTDRAFLAMDSGRSPEQFGVVLRLDTRAGLDLPRLRLLMAQRVAAIPRLRRRLIRTPPGCGGPIWVDDAAFDVGRHVRARRCPSPHDGQVVLDTAWEVIATPLPRTAPLWAAVLLTDGRDVGVALVVVLHHVLADGVGGLAALEGFVDQQARPVADPFPRPRPPTASLAREAWRRRLQAVRGLARNLRLLRSSMAAGGGMHPPRAAQCSLLARPGPRRRVVAVRIDYRALAAAAHRRGATTNDAVLVAVAGALRRVLCGRGEDVATIAICVPVSGRPRADGPAMGNLVSPLLVAVPGAGPVDRRLAQVRAQVLALKESASGPPPIALLGWLFRPMAALGGFRWYMRHQHRLHTLVSHVRGPTAPMSIGGAAITEAVPIAVGPPGNLTVYFEVMSYAGTLTLTACLDPDRFPDLDVLVDSVRAEFDAIIGRVDQP
jgi:diacylglycerol O-acyltransferase / wax synthase